MYSFQLLKWLQRSSKHRARSIFTLLTDGLATMKQAADDHFYLLKVLKFFCEKISDLMKHLSFNIFNIGDQLTIENKI